MTLVSHITDIQMFKTQCSSTDLLQPIIHFHSIYILYETWSWWRNVILPQRAVPSGVGDGEEFPFSSRPLWGGYIHSSGLSPFQRLNVKLPTWEEKEQGRDRERGGERGLFGRDTQECWQFINRFQEFKTSLLSTLLSSFISSLYINHWGYIEILYYIF